MKQTSACLAVNRGDDRGPQSHPNHEADVEVLLQYDALQHRDNKQCNREHVAVPHWSVARNELDQKSAKQSQNEDGVLGLRRSHAVSTRRV